MTMESEKTKVQAMLDHNRITASIAMFDGVLVTRVFEGSGCYDQFVEFLKSQFGTDSAIRSSIIVVDAAADSK
ncbi:MAG TPA: hypothetical protein VHA09_00310 [Nitrososphaera sp.]|nr:hypothetical protein [Nitrososphaera sp.]